MAARQGPVQRAVVPDPGITVGPYRLLTRTDGYSIAFDTRSPPGEGTAYKHKSKDRVLEWMKEHAEET